jgi:hypothetical protein
MTGRTALERQGNMHRHPIIAAVTAAFLFAALPALPAATASHHPASAAGPLDGKIGGGVVQPAGLA